MSDICVIMLTPSHNGGRTIRECLRHVKKLDPGPSYHIFVTNNCSDGTDDYIDNHLDKHPGHRISWDFPADFTERMKDPYSAIAIARQRLLLEARRMMECSTCYTHALYLDDDVYLILPTTLKRLLDHGVDMVSGSYLRLFHQSHEPKVAALWRGEDGSMLRKERSYMKALERPFLISAGCLLLTREVVLDPRVNFFPIYKPEGMSDVSEDFGFCRSLRKLGYMPHLDCVVPINHHIFDDIVDKPWFKDSRGEYVKFRFPEGSER